MRHRKSGTGTQPPTQVGSNGFVNRRSTVQSRPPALGSQNQKNPSSHRRLVADAIAAGASEIGARRLLRDLLDLGRSSRNSRLGRSETTAKAEALALRALELEAWTDELALGLAHGEISVAQVQIETRAMAGVS